MPEWAAGGASAPEFQPFMSCLSGHRTRSECRPWCMDVVVMCLAGCGSDVQGRDDPARVCGVVFGSSPY